MEQFDGLVPLWLGMALAVMLALLLPAVAASAGGTSAAQTFIVDRADDPGMSLPCATDALDNDCSLRAAVAAANANGNPSATDVILIAVPGPIMLTTDEGSLQPTESIEIGPQDPDAEVTVDASGLSPRSRVFTFSGAASSGLERLVVTGGMVGDGDGGGINVTGDVALSLDRVTVAGNTATFEGGGVFVGGIDAQLDVTDSTILDNDGGFGGGLTVRDAPASITGSTVTGNTADEGGGIANASGTLTITNSTIHDNTATPRSIGAGRAGGISATSDGGGRLDLSQVTLTDNTAAAGEDQNLRADMVVTAFNSVIAGGPTTGPNCSSTVLSVGGNLSDDTSCIVSDSEFQDDVVEGGGPFGDLGLTPLGEFGGPTLTRALYTDSEAFNSGVTTSGEGGGDRVFAQGGLTCRGVTTDQRGEPRPDDASTGTFICDRGAFEAAMLLPRGGAGPGPAPARADLVVDKTGPARVTAGEQVTWTILTTNAGPDRAQNVQLVDTLPAGVTFASASAGCAHATGTVTCVLGTLADGVSVTTTISATTSTAGTLTNVAEVDSATTDPDVSDNSDDHLTDVIDVSRCAGVTRITTAIQCSVDVFASAPDVVLTRSDLFPDAQAGTPLAVDLGAPLLLSEPAALNGDTEEEIMRVLEPGGRVHLLGGTEALSVAVEDRLAELGISTVRYPGVNRFATAVLIAEGLGNPSVALLADGGDFPDSVIAGAAAVVAGAEFAQAQPAIAAVLLTSGTAVPPETAAYLDGRDTTLFAVGGNAAEAFPAAEALMGATRFETGVAVAERFFPAPAAAGLATGLDFADALVGGAIVGAPAIGPGPMLLTDPDVLPDAVADYLADHVDTLDGVLIFGGTAAVSAEVEDAVSTILGAD